MLAPMAEAIARHHFPNSGQYESAAPTPAMAFDAQMAAFMAGRQVDIAGTAPRALDKVPSELAEYHVIVSLEGPVGDYVKDIPFHTVALEWDIAQKAEDNTLDHDAVYRALTVQVRHLMEQLRGPGAD